MGRDRARRPQDPRPTRVRAVQRGRDLTGSLGAADDEILDWVRATETALHPSCTCRMGVEATSVLDRRRCACTAVAGLRVVDAVSMRYITNGNITRR